MEESEQGHAPIVVKGVIFGFALLVYEILICVVYGVLLGPNDVLAQSYKSGDIYLITGLSFLTIAGFGLLNAYTVNGAFSGMGFSLLSFVITVQHLLLFRLVAAEIYRRPEDNQAFKYITFANGGDQASLLIIGSLADAIACALCFNIALSSIIHKLNLLELFIASIISSLFYELNLQLLYALKVSDIGYGMRVFVFGSFMGTISLIFNRSSLETQKNDSPIYSTRTLGLLGTMIIFATFPFLCAAGLYRTSKNYEPILYIAIINMWLALSAGALGSLAACTIIYKRVHMHNIVLSAISGGIAFSSISNMHSNPGIPLGIGFGVGLIVSFFNWKSIQRIKIEGQASKFMIINRYIIESVIAGILSAIFASSQPFVKFVPADRTSSQQGGMQIAGLFISIGLGSIAGVIIGLIIRALRTKEFIQSSIVYEHELKNKKKVK